LPAMTPDIDVLAVARLSPLLAPQLAAAYRVHDRLHETDPVAFAAVAPRIRGIAASGDSKVGAGLIASLPSLEIISVMGAGYDGIEVFENEPQVHERLKAPPHVVLVPHIGSATGQTRQAMADLAAGNLAAHFAGRPLLSPVPEMSA